MNYTHIIGRLARDAEERFTPDGQKVIVLVLASSVWKKGQEVTIWWRVSFWGNRFDKMLPYLTKGKPIMVGGELSNKPEIYTDKNGQPQVGSLEVRGEYMKFMPFGKAESEESGEGRTEEAKPASVTASSSQSQTENEFNPFDDEPLPF